MNQTELFSAIQQTILEVSSRQKRPFSYENLALTYSALHPEQEPFEIAELFNQLELVPGKVWDGKNIISLYRSMRLTKIEERRKMMAAAVQNSRLLMQAIDGDTQAMVLYRQSCTDKTGLVVKRITFQLLRHHLDKNLSEEAQSAAVRLNRDFSAECLAEAADQIEAYLHSKTTGTVVAIDPVVKLQNDLARTRDMLRSMQDEFDERLEDSKAQEQEEFFAKLNSQEYGYILDLLQSAQRGFKKLREKRIQVPLEIRSVQTVIRRMMEFLDDYDVVPMMEVDTTLQITLSDINELQYEGTPFLNDREVKTVKVISPGWKMENRDIVISYPRVTDSEE